MCAGKGRFLAELVFQLAVLAAGYALGAGLAALAVLLFGIPLAANGAAFLVLTLPILSALVAEGFTGLWGGTPGALGTGGLVVFVPMAIAGVVSFAAARVTQSLFAPFERSLPRHSDSLTLWVCVALACSVVALVLWRFWPEPRARLF